MEVRGARAVARAPSPSLKPRGRVGPGPYGVCVPSSQMAPGMCPPRRCTAAAQAGCRHCLRCASRLYFGWASRPVQGLGDCGVLGWKAGAVPCVRAGLEGTLKHGMCPCSCWLPLALAISGHDGRRCCSGAAGCCLRDGPCIIHQGGDTEGTSSPGPGPVGSLRV